MVWITLTLFFCCQNGINSSLLIHGCLETLAIVSVRHYKWCLVWWLGGRDLYEATTYNFVAQGESSLVYKLTSLYMGWNSLLELGLEDLARPPSNLGLTHCEVDHSIFIKCSHTHSNKHIYFVMYVNDIVITGDDYVGIEALKTTLVSSFLNQGFRQVVIFPWDWIGSILGMYCYLTKKVCSQYFGGIRIVIL